MQYFSLFINQLLNYGNFKSSEIPRKYHRELLTEFSKIKNKDSVFIPSLIKLCKNTEGRLIIDDTNNPKYGLKKIARKMKNLKTSGYESGYKILLFLWETDNYRIPIGFSLWHKESPSLNELALQGLGILRNTFKLKPKVVLADGFYSADKVVKRLTDYGYPLVERWRNNRKLDGLKIKQQIPRGFGDYQGYLQNGCKVKIFRRRNRFYISNRMLLSMKDAVKLYKKRWTIEETFKILKSQIGLNRCQQHSLQSQEIFLFLCMIAFSYLEKLKDYSVYKTRETVIFQSVSLDNSILMDVFNPC
ncbi:MAG: hypothetical protein A2255_10955 [Candidatus Melainabacteria bacterium RIFOXYA2_FULL_32_9]|nr:MAG: hypothetical protein A2255_10955 [Candidatus Melainabacteria bacterium RIFOXYA2_FULL_32_9]